MAKSLTKPTDSSQVQTTRKAYMCSRCGKVSRSQDKYFLRSGSQIYRSNGGYTTVCLDCMEDMFNTYVTEHESFPEAAEHVCRKLDLYWNPERFDDTKSTQLRSQFGTYLFRMASTGDYARTYDNTIEDRRIEAEAEEAAADEDEDVVPDKVVEFWGDGFSPKQYYELERTYKRWTSGKDLTDADEIGLYRQIAMTDWQITQAAAAGGSTERLSQAMNGLLGKTKISSKYSPTDNKTVGEKIRDWETESPVPEPTPEFRDVDGIVRYITTWFMGHFTKMFGIKNSYNALYEEAMEKYKVERPEYVDSDDDESLFESIFGGKRGGDA